MAQTIEVKTNTGTLPCPVPEFSSEQQAAFMAAIGEPHPDGFRDPVTGGYITMPGYDVLSAVKGNDFAAAFSGIVDLWRRAFREKPELLERWNREHPPDPPTETTGESQ